MDRDEMSNRYRGPPIDASYKVLVHLAKQFQRRRLIQTTKCMVSMNCLKNIFTFKSKIENLKITLLLFVLQDAVRERQDGDI
jgi:hypothetical protein